MKRMNLQLFAEPTGEAGGTEPSAGDQNQQQTQTQTGQQASLAIDYAKIQQMLEGTLATKEGTALKAYFEQQGLSQEEVEQTIAAFKQQKVASQLDVIALWQQAIQAQTFAQQVQVQTTATMTAVSLGIGAKIIPHALKMAGLSQVMGQNEKTSDEVPKTALGKMLENVPALKPQAPRTTGFIQMGVASRQQQTANEPMTLKDTIPTAFKK